MNTKSLKRMGAAVLLLVGIGTAFPALADTFTGLQSLGFAANATRKDLSPFPSVRAGGHPLMPCPPGAPGRYTMVFKKTASGVERYVGTARYVKGGGAIFNPLLYAPDQPVGVSKPGRCP